MRPRSKKAPIRITLYIEAESREHLHELAAADKRSPSQFIEIMIEKAWEKEIAASPGKKTKARA